MVVGSVAEASSLQDLEDDRDARDVHSVGDFRGGFSGYVLEFLPLCGPARRSGRHRVGGIQLPSLPKKMRRGGAGRRGRCVRRVTNGT